MGATPPADPTLGTRDHTPMRHIITVTLRIAEASPFTLHPRITAIGTADPDTGITAGIVISKVARSLARPPVAFTDSGLAYVAANSFPSFAAPYCETGSFFSARRGSFASASRRFRKRSRSLRAALAFVCSSAPGTGLSPTESGQNFYEDPNARSKRLRRRTSLRAAPGPPE